MINIIVAYDENRVIGKDNKLPWHIPEDFKHFKETTMGCPCIVGRRTYEGMGALKGRLNIVLSRTGGVGGLPSSDPVFYEYSLEEAIALARESKVCTEQGKDIFILGGSEVYKYALNANIIDKIIAEGSPNLPLTNSKDIVIRKSDYICNRTLAINANKAACDLSSNLVEKLKDPKKIVKIILLIN